VGSFPKVPAAVVPQKPKSLTSDQAVLALLALLEEHRQALRRNVRIGLGFTDGTRCVIDATRDRVLVAPWSRDTDLAILTNGITMTDLFCGRFDPEHPQEHQTFLWAGEPDTMMVVADALGGSVSWIAVRSAAVL